MMTSDMKSYPAYKNSGVEWLGEIPAHWEVKPLKRWASLIQTGSTPPTSNTQYFAEGTVPWHGPGSFSSDLLLRPAARMVTESAIQDRVARIFDKESSMIVTIGSTIGKVGFVNEPSSCNQQITAVTFDSKDVFAKYAGYQLKRLEPILGGIAPNTTLPILDQGQVGCLPFFGPPMSEQRAIAAFLDRETAKIDALVAKKERLIELLQEKRTALISHAVTKGLDPDVPLKDSGVEWLGEIPAHWEVKRVSQISEILRGKFTHRPRNDPALYDGPYPFVQTGDVTRARKEITSYRQTLNERGLGVSKMFPSGTLVMTIAANIGDVAVLDFAACFPDSVVGFVPRSGIERDFLFFVFLAMKPELLREAPVNTQGNLNIERIGSIGSPIPVPSESEQRLIAAFLDRETAQIDALIAKVQEAIDRLKELRTALISAAVTGKIDVREAAA